MAAINGTYYEIVKTSKGDSLYSSFFKKDGNIKTSVTVSEDNRLFWKHEGAFYYDEPYERIGDYIGMTKFPMQMHSVASYIRWEVTYSFL